MSYRMPEGGIGSEYRAKPRGHSTVPKENRNARDLKSSDW